MIFKRIVIFTISQIAWVLIDANLMKKSTKTVTTHDVFYPTISYHKVKTFNQKSRRAIEDDPYLVEQKMTVEFHALGKDFNLHLHSNNKLLAPNFQVETLDKHGEIKDSHSVDNCFYNGRINRRNDTLISLSNCNGLSGIIQNGKEQYYIKPIHHNHDNTTETNKRRPHVIRRTTEYNEADISNMHQRFTRYITGSDESDCGLDDVKPHVRWVRDIRSDKVGEQTIETMLAIDQKMTQYYGMDAAKQYALTIANAAHNILRDSTIGPNTVNMVITKLIILTAPLNDLTINHHARDSLASFGRWANDRNSMESEHPDHYDYSVLITKHDICVDKNQPCETKGLSYVGGMCEDKKSASIIEDDGFGAAFTLAHQTGHSLGMDHDSVGNTCADSKRIMSTYGGKKSDAFHWSTCSTDYLQQFLRKDQSKCLEDQPARSKREVIKTYDNPGRIDDATMQCQFIYGDNTKSCNANGDTSQICGELTCIHPVFNNCSGVGKPSLDGTPCDDKKWCKQGVCVFKDNENNDNIVDGGWAEWTKYQECSRTCGGGITFRERSCDNPTPKNGGEYCEGESRMYTLCNKQACVAPTVNFRKTQCENMGKVYYGDQLLNWTYYEDIPDMSCELRCEPTITKKVVKYFGHVSDGTECVISSLEGRCIQGECNTVGCDLVLGSLQKRDRCGVCKGDGSTCIEEIDLSKNPLILSQEIKNNDISKRIEILEKKKTENMEQVASKLIQLRHIIQDIAVKHCNGDESCINNYNGNITKKNSIQTLPNKFSWVTKSQGCSVSCGRGTETHEVECQRLDDNTPVSDELCTPLVKLNGFIKGCQRSPCPPSWSTSTWNACTRSCGGGRKTRYVYCALNDGLEEYNLPRSQCNESKKPIQTASCNLEPCPLEWYAEPYGECSKSCGTGVKTRQVRCRSLDKTGNEVVFPDKSCFLIPMPERDMLCNVHNLCPGEGTCGGTWSDVSGEISSPSYPSDYNNNEECVHEINAEKDHNIKLNFTVMDIVSTYTQFNGEQCAGDYLQITEGKCFNSNDHPSMKLCGKRLPGLYTSTENNLCLKFVSDQSVHSKGFALKYQIEEKPKLKHDLKDICDINGGHVNSSLGVLTSPNYPRLYRPNEECKITLLSPDGTGFMIKFDAFQVGTRSGVMKCKTDYLEFIYDDKVEQLCGTETSIPTIIIPSTKLVIKFHSSPLKLKRKGFVLTYVTKAYARQYAVTQHSINNINAYSTTLNEWRSRQPTFNRPTTFTKENENTTQSLSQAILIRKNTIGRSQAQNMINNRRQLIRVLMNLANDSHVQPTKKDFMDRHLTTSRSNVPPIPSEKVAINTQNNQLNDANKKPVNTPILGQSYNKKNIYLQNQYQTQNIDQKVNMLQSNLLKQQQILRNKLNISTLGIKKTSLPVDGQQNTLMTQQIQPAVLPLPVAGQQSNLKTQQIQPAVLFVPVAGQQNNFKTQQTQSAMFTPDKTFAVPSTNVTTSEATNEGIGTRVHKGDIPRPPVENTQDKLKAAFTSLQPMEAAAPYQDMMSRSSIPTSRGVYNNQNSYYWQPLPQQMYHNQPRADWSTAQLQPIQLQHSAGLQRWNFPVATNVHPYLYQQQQQQQQPYASPLFQQQIASYKQTPNVMYGGVKTATNTAPIQPYPTFNMNYMQQHQTNQIQQLATRCPSKLPLKCEETLLRPSCLSHADCMGGHFYSCCSTDCSPVKWVCLPNG